MSKRLSLLVALVLAVLGVVEVHAESPLTGSFMAADACPALQSIRKGTNPGNVTLVPGTLYRIVAGNTDTPTYFWIVVPGANPPNRWVATTCGSADTGAGSTAAVAPPAGPAKAGRTALVLAASWEPAFCEGQSGKPECRAQKDASFGATHFSLHGLWPQPRSRAYCNVATADRDADKAHDWQALPEPPLSAATRAGLEAVMPGTRSNLQRHEWIVHGTCYGTDADRYFADAVTLISALNASPVRQLFADNIGRQLTLAQIRGAFDTAFGAGAGERVRVACDNDGNRRLISELTIGLSGKISADADISALILAAAPTDGGCTAGVVDPVGLQ